jgi:hypothetical protein
MASRKNPKKAVATAIGFLKWAKTGSLYDTYKVKKCVSSDGWNKNK